jgi:hypothetical protein
MSKVFQVLFLPFIAAQTFLVNWQVWVHTPESLWFALSEYGPHHVSWRFYFERSQLTIDFLPSIQAVTHLSRFPGGGFVFASGGLIIRRYT